MCGITGLLASLQASEMEDRLRSMANQLAHRGPDDAGIWHDISTGIGLAHRRLSIIDVSASGHQPMHSASRRFVITYNGEIYNYAELMRELEQRGHVFQGHSDTAVLLAGFEQWGIEATIRKCVGMFAFGVWDRDEHVLTLVRDRLGIKPLYYGWVADSFVFASELKALHVLPGFQNPIRLPALEFLLRYNYIPAPYSIYERIYKLPAGTILQIIPGKLPDPPTPASYWSARDVVLQGQDSPLLLTDRDAIDQTEVLLRDAVGGCMVSDVPVGVFLSGGLDSSTVTALMQIQSSQPVRTFSIGFEEDAFNEAGHAKIIADHLGTQHTELYITSRDALAIIPHLPDIYDEPFADPSQIPTVLVSQLARQHVKVSLSGDGGDELFGGYKRYRLVQEIWRRVAWLGSGGRHALGRLIKASPVQSMNGISGTFTQLFARYGSLGSIEDKLSKLALTLDANSLSGLYDNLLSNKWTMPPCLPGSNGNSARSLPGLGGWMDLSDRGHSMMYLDMVTYLPDDILVKLDRAGMSVGLEGRLPLLDHRLVEFLWRLPLVSKTRKDQSKWLMRQVLYRYIPQEKMERPKQGFALPLAAWLRVPLRDWAEDLLSEAKLNSCGFLDPVAVRRHWAEHTAGQRNWYFGLWAVLMFQAWFEKERSFIPTR